ncbi:hypothetical protein [Cryobacterium sp. Y11]|uniref:GntT/GntP/DsdX family permease n=1 Tax=Cryobacterium sp. Y11 TaxID=2045016 RepID=UPI001E44B436|nr:hypothetical protein [Cryobacterium sp. Y11]
MNLKEKGRLNAEHRYPGDPCRRHRLRYCEAENQSLPRAACCGVGRWFYLRPSVAEIAPIITTAFGASLGNIGLIILFGTIIGVILERTGAAISTGRAALGQPVPEKRH